MTAADSGRKGRVRAETRPICIPGMIERKDYAVEDNARAVLGWSEPR
jgi:hypothetical protein